MRPQLLNAWSALCVLSGRVATAGHKATAPALGALPSLGCSRREPLSHAHTRLCSCVRGTHTGREGRERRGAKCSAVKISLWTLRGTHRCLWALRHLGLRPTDPGGWSGAGEQGELPAARKACPWAILVWEALIAGANQQVPFSDAGVTSALR